MRLIFILFLLSIVVIGNAQKKHWINNDWNKVKKEGATSYYTLTKTEAKTYLVNRYNNVSDSLIEILNYPTKDLLSKEGAYACYFDNGKTKEKGKYLNNLKTGVWSYHREQGSLEKTITFSAGIKEGLQADYTSREKLDAVYSYKGDNLKSLVHFFDDNDSVIFKEDTSDGAVYTFVDQEALFPEGEEALKLFLEKGGVLKINGVIVYISFCISTNGMVSEIEVMNLDDENTSEQIIKKALKLIAKLPKWEPAMHRGRRVKLRKEMMLKL